AQRVVELAAALNEQELIHSFEDQVGCQFTDRLLKLEIGLGARVLRSRQRRCEPLLEVRLGNNLAVDFDQYLFNDLRPERNAGQKSTGQNQARRRRNQSVCHLNSLELNMLNNSSNRPKMPFSALGSSSGRRRISSFENPPCTSP